MNIKNTIGDSLRVTAINTTVFSIATFTNLEIILKIILLLVTIFYTADKWYYNKKKRNEQKKETRIKKS